MGHSLSIRQDGSTDPANDLVASQSHWLKRRRTTCPAFTTERSMSLGEFTASKPNSELIRRTQEVDDGRDYYRTLRKRSSR